MNRAQRFAGNPIVSPITEHAWESLATLNPAAIYIDGNIHLLYRAMSADNESSFGYAMTKDGVTIVERLDYPVYIPREEFEIRKLDHGNYGCEDARLTKIGDRIYMCYVAYAGVVPRIAVTSISESDFLSHKWNWEKAFVLTPTDFDEKDACIFPEEFAKGYFMLHRIHNDICGEYLSSLDFSKTNVTKCSKIIGVREGMWDNYKVGIAAPPIKTEHGWLVLYHGIDKKDGTFTYRVGSMLLDLKDPTIVLARDKDFILEPEAGFEKNGEVDNVVFPCGVIEKDDLLYIYYGGGDREIGVATIPTLDVLRPLVESMQIKI